MIEVGGDAGVGQLARGAARGGDADRLDSRPPTQASRAAASAVVLPVPGSAATATIRSPPVVRRRTICACSALR